MSTMRPLLSLAVVAVISTGYVVSASAQQPPIIERIEPTSGPVGTEVQIIGRRFDANGSVSLNGSQLQVTQRLPNRWTVRIVAGATTGRLTMDGGGSRTVGPEFRVTEAQPPPYIERIDPAQGAPGAEVTITGRNFSPRPTENTVTLGDRPVVVRAATPFSLSVIVPDGAANAPFVVRVRGAGEGRSPQPFNVLAGTTVADFQPRVGPPGTRVTLRGTGFSATARQNRVYMNNVPVRVETASTTQLVVSIPASAASGPILVDVRNGGRAETPAPFVIQYAPTIASFDPLSGPPGRQVTIRGSGFGADIRVVQVTLAGRPVTIRAMTPNELVVEIPTGATTGRFSITVNGVGPATATRDYDVLMPVGITDFQPRSGPVGTNVTITGLGFSPRAAENVVSLSGVRAQVLAASSTELRVRVPAAQSGPFDVTVSSNGTARSTVAFMVTVPPFLAAFEPTRGPIGTEVQVRGTGFGTNVGLVEVTVGGRPMQLRSVTDTLITAIVPSDAQTGRISVVVRLQGSSTSATDFTVLPPFSISALTPAIGPVGTELTLRGVGFVPGMRLDIGGVNAGAVNFVGPLEIRARVPRGAQTGAVTLRHPDGRVAGAPTNYTVTTAPTILAFEPPLGVVGSQVTIRGTNFGTDASAIQLSLGAKAMAITSIADTQIVAIIPPDAQTGAFTLARRDYGTNTSRTSFRVLSTFSVAGFSPATGMAGTLVTLRGEGFTATGMSVDFAGTNASPITFVSAQEIRVVVPRNATTGAISVRSSDGRLLPMPGVFTVQPTPSGVGIVSVEPTCVRPGCTVVLRGYGFSPNMRQNRVTFSTAPVRVEAATSEMLQISLPQNPGTAPIVVDVRNVGRAESAPFTIQP